MMEEKNPFRPYSDVFEIARRYFRIYGGVEKLISSPYLHFSVIISALCFPSWSDHQWPNTPLSVLPNLVGFTLGGFAVFLAFSNERFASIMAQKDPDEEYSAFMNSCASFVHFILVQGFALIYAVIAKAVLVEKYESFHYIFSFLGYFLFIYSLNLIIAVTFSLLRVSSNYEVFLQNSIEEDGDNTADLPDPQAGAEQKILNDNTP
jgi:hypothetical protein